MNPSGGPPLGARVAGQLAAVLLVHQRGDEVVDWAERALRLAPDPEQTVTDLIRYLPLNGLGLSGRADVALASVASLPDPSVASISELDALLGRGVLRTWTDDLAGARSDLTGVLAASHDRSVAFRVPEWHRRGRQQPGTGPPPGGGAVLAWQRDQTQFPVSSLDGHWTSRVFASL